MALHKLKKNRFTLIFLCAIVIILAGALLFPSWKSSQNLPLPTAKDYNFYLITDFGTAGGTHGNKKQVAQQMNLLATKVVPRFIITAGDNFHDAAPKSATDTVWRWNFEQFFALPYIKELKWYAALGNHDYSGDPDAQLAYAKIHPYWIMPARYYTFVEKVDDSTSVRVLMLDTSPFLKSYHKRFGDAKFPNTDKQLHWVDSVLASSHERWKIAIGHHPIYHSGFFSGNTTELIDQLNPILKKYKVDFYFSGHVHTFQHNQKGGIDYVTTASAWQSRMVTPWFYTKYWKSATGFTLCSVNYHHFSFYFINEKGAVLYSYSRKK